MFALSIFLPIPYSFYIWASALAISLILPISLIIIGRKNGEIQAELERTIKIRPSLVERFGLFTIIVLGELIISIVQGITSQTHPSWLAGGIVALSLLIAIGMWWVYFDFISYRSPIQTTKKNISLDILASNSNHDHCHDWRCYFECCRTYRSFVVR